MLQLLDDTTAATVQYLAARQRELARKPGTDWWAPGVLRSKRGQLSWKDCNDALRAIREGRAPGWLAYARGRLRVYCRADFKERLPEGLRPTPEEGDRVNRGAFLTHVLEQVDFGLQTFRSAVDNGREAEPAIDPWFLFVAKLARGGQLDLGRELSADLDAILRDESRQPPPDQAGDKAAWLMAVKAHLVR